MIEWTEGEIESKADRVEQRTALGNSSSEFIERLQQEINTLKANLEHLGSYQRYAMNCSSAAPVTTLKQLVATKPSGCSMI